jgi:hypothetical protein
MAQAGIPNEARPEAVSPKVKAVGWSGFALTAALVVVVAFLSAIPSAAFAGLGIWAVPASTAVASLVNFLSGYLKADPAREPTVIQETAIAAPVDPEAEATVAVPDVDSDSESETSDGISGVWYTPDADSETAGGSTVAEVDEFARLNQSTGNTPKHRAD